ncbi:hypothetical protein K461DRAFT_264225 [Myriangium duriaei CBS 260.36]|uniref:Uncharacterized protein n=1 Tax=Myriangium duriaei CBS 260.36 TaxID=1168546 RepID=A0A9P4MPJ2_9PEZI|nr:hypothetical protein K461DRAFT_264225 [Myriangium duriaei CBS 260.36]
MRRLLANGRPSGGSLMEGHDGGKQVQSRTNSDVTLSASLNAWTKRWRIDFGPPHPHSGGDAHHLLPVQSNQNAVCGLRSSRCSSDSCTSLPAPRTTGCSDGMQPDSKIHPRIGRWMRALAFFPPLRKGSRLPKSTPPLLQCRVAPRHVSLILQRLVVARMQSQCGLMWSIPEYAHLIITVGRLPSCRR